MRKHYLLLVLCSICISAFSQTGRQISGTVTASGTKQPLDKVTVTEKGTRNFTLTDSLGNFSMVLSTNDATLVFSYIGYQDLEIKAGNATNVDVQLLPNTSDLSEVVVTALGIKRELRSLGYASQQVSSQQITQSKQPNLINALQGKVAGVTISSTGGGPGQSASILIRGINSLDPGKNNQPLFVIDGLPIDNSTFTTGTEGGRGVQMPNRVSDINPEDIESVNILRGGAATALYGLRGANGVVVITTKSGQAGTLKVNYSSTYSIDNVNKIPDIQLKYTQGFSGEYDSSNFWPAWGPTIAEAKAIDPSHPDKLFNNWKRAYQTGHQYKNAVTFSGGSEKATFSSSLSHFRQDGTIPFTWYQDVTARVNGQLKFSDKFRMGTSIIYANTDGNFYDADRYNEELIYWAPRWDVMDYKKPDGTQKTYGNGNPVYLAATNKFRTRVDHVIGSLNFAYSPFTWLTASYLLGMDEYSDARTATAPGPQGIPGEIPGEDNGLGFVHEYRLNYHQLNSNLLLTFDKTWAGKFQTTLRIGNDVLNRKLDRTSAIGDELDVYNLFNLSNAKQVSIAQYKENYRIVGAYGDLTLGYDNFLYLNLTARNDWTSTLETANRSFFYPSVNLSYIFTQNLQLPAWIGYGKLRASLAGIGKDAAPYQTSITYSPSFGTPVNGVIGWSRDDNGGIASLQPEKTTSFEAGTDLNFFKDRVGLNFTWYKSNSKQQIIPVSTAPSTGGTSFTLNSGEIENKGVELTLRGTPVKTKDFNWDVTINYSANRSKILSIYPGLAEIVVGSQFGYSNSTVTMKYVPGQSAGDIFGTPWARYNDTKDPLYSDKSLPLLIGDDGFPVLTPYSTQRVLGNAYPKWIGSIGNTFNYKNWSLYMLWDARQGLEKYDQFSNFMAAFGISEITLNRDQTIVFDGVLADGTKNTKPVYLGQGVGPDGVDYSAGYYRNRYRGIAENFVEDASWVRLRSASLSYTFPNKMFGNSIVKNLSLGVTGNNLLLFTKYKGFDPESSSTPAGSNANGFAGFTYPALRSVVFSLNVGF
ncbi:SusC/RagA family TonB-linked outer membrane protein [Ilyomonas limi]|uniref:SusC/RagA family TonB-linked outer membrane protein n=1 Tax=Ilyomonas limi TaxID=2575867 RepID=A0A4U3LAE3_9BACT|nr:SusC/RagA family TonB-linked outer membrane protein [Ilyomonas limi]TKK71639.1 SusC/RagA family TonB-linked outer membrane protein [Ilyomonas limi]